MTMTSNPQGGGASPDSFFVLRETRTLLQEGLMRILEKAGASRPAVQAFAETFEAAHDELVAAKPRTGFEAAHGLTASRISLVSESDLELDIRLGGIAKHLSDLGKPLWRVHARYMTLLKRRQMEPDENPLGPEVICRALQALCKDSGLKPEANFELLGRIEAGLLEQLPLLYDAANDLLASRNIEPAALQGQTRPESSRSAPSTSGRPDTPAADPFAALQALMSVQSGAPLAVPLTGMPSGGGFAEGLAMPLPATAGGFPAIEGFAGHPGAGAGMDVALQAATLNMLNQLATRLDQLGSLTIAAESGLKPELASGRASGSGEAAAAAQGEGGGAAAEAASSEMQMPQPIRAADLGVEAGRPEAVAVDTLALIFSGIFETWVLPDTIKTAIGRLQCPYMKLSLFDRSLFVDPDHPARQLVNAMGRAACGLPRTLPRAHRVASRLWQIAGTVKSTLHNDARVLDGPLAEVEALIAERDGAILAEAQPFITLLRNKEARDLANKDVQAWRQTVESQGIAQSMQSFLRFHWTRVMENAWLQGGQRGEPWRQAETVFADLLSSVHPVRNAEERTALMRAIPDLLRRMGALLDEAGIDAETRQPFLDSLFLMQTAAMRGEAPQQAGADSASATAPQPVGAESADGPLASESLEEDGRQLRLIRQSASKELDAAGEAGGIEVGQWLEFDFEGDEPRCGLVCWRNSQTGTLLLLNPDWGHAMALSAAVLSAWLQEGKTRIASARRLFDDAAEQALHRLQEDAGG